MVSNTLILEVTDELHGRRLDAALGALDDSHSRTLLKKCIDEGLVTLDGKVAAKANLKVSTGQKIAVSFPKMEVSEAQAQDLPLNTVYFDDDILVVDKPAGFVVHPGAGVNDGTVMNALLYHFPQTAILPRCGIVHRLDKDTSGLMVIALSRTAQTYLTRAISKHKVIREYEAVAEGEMISGGTVNAPIARDPHNRTRMAVMPEGLGREAVTHYRIMERFRAHTRLRLRLETGRTHQIRVHMAHIHHPLLGDPQYGGRRIKHIPGAGEELKEALRNFNHQALHAVHLEFDHPISGSRVSFDSKIPEKMAKLLELLRKDTREHGFN